MKEKYLGLDPSLNSFGYCILEVEPSGYILNTYTGTIKTKKYRNIFKSFSIMEELESIKIFDNISFVGIEHYHYKSNSSNQYELGEIGGILRWNCFKKNVGLVEIPPCNLKKFATGNGLASKEKVTIKAIDFLKLYNTSNDFNTNDESDAFWAAVIGMSVAKIDKIKLNDRDKWDIIWKIKSDWEVQYRQSPKHPHPKFYLVQQNQRNRSSIRNSHCDKFEL